MNAARSFFPAASGASREQKRAVYTRAFRRSHFERIFEENKKERTKQWRMIARIGPLSLGVSAMHRFRKNTFPVGHAPSRALTSAAGRRINEIAVRRYWDTACCGSVDIYFRRSPLLRAIRAALLAPHARRGSRRWQTLPRLVSIYSGFPRFPRLCRARSAPPVCIILYLFRLVTPRRPANPFPLTALRSS